MNNLQSTRENYHKSIDYKKNNRENQQKGGALNPKD